MGSDSFRPPAGQGGIRRKMSVKPATDGDPTSPTVSVIIPCYNYAHFLGQSVGSALRQTGVTVDVIVVDDASTDDSVQVARRLAASDQRVRVVAREANRGPVETFNAGLALTRGEFVVRLDADDMLTPGSLARATALARSFPSVGLVYGHPEHFTNEPPAEHRDVVRGWTIWPGGQWLADRCADGFNVITSPEVLMRSSVVDRVGGQQPLKHTHDMEMWFRIAAVSDVGYIRGPDQAWHRDHAASLSMTHTDPIEELMERRRAFDTLFSGVAGQRPDAQTLEEAAHRALAVNALVSAIQNIDRGRLAEISVDDLLRFATETDPGIVDSRPWRSLQSRLSPPRPVALQRLRSFVSARAFSLQKRLDAARWRRFGTYSGR